MRESSAFLEPIGFFLLFASNLFFSLIILKNWKARLTNILMVLIYPAVCTFAVIGTAKFITFANEPSSYVVLFIVGLLTLIFLLKITLEEALFLSVFQVFHIIFVKGISAGILSIIFSKNMFQLFQVSQYSQLITCLAFGILFILFCMYYLFFNKKKMVSFFLCKGQVYFVMTIHTLITLYLLFNCYNFYYNIDLIWFSVEQVYTCLIFYAIFFIVLNFSTLISNLIQNELRQKNQDYKILSQVSILESNESTSDFIAYYKNASAEIKDLINKEQKLDALEQLKFLDNKLKAMGDNSFKNISDFKMINAFFYDFITLCNKKNIKLEGEFFFSNDIKLEEKELYEILYNLLQNSLESNLKIQDISNRYIKINTKKNEKNIIITISNGYNRKPRTNNGFLISSKKHTELEGFGIGCVNQILEKNKGNAKFKIDDKNKSFTSEITLKYK